MTRQEFERQLRQTVGAILWTIAPWDNQTYYFYEISTTLGDFQAWYYLNDPDGALDGLGKLGLAIQNKFEEATKLIQMVFNPINREAQVSHRGFVSVRDPQGFWIPTGHPVEHFHNPLNWETLRQQYLKQEGQYGYAN